MPIVRSVVLGLTGVLLLTRCGGEGTAGSPARPIERGDASTPDPARPDGDASASSDAAPGCPLVNGLCSATPLYQSKIGLWYTLWWMPGGDSGHWKDWSRYQPQAGFYQSGAGPAFAAHLKQFSEMKLDFLLLDHTNGVGNDGGNMQKNGEAIVAALESGKSDLKQAVANGCALWCGASPDRVAQQAEDDYIFAKHSAPDHPSRFLRNDSPLLVVYTAPGKGDDWTDSRFDIGFASGMASEASQPMIDKGVFGWVFSEPTRIDKRVMGVMPGWATDHLGRATTPIGREGGGLFVRQWLRAIKANPEIIIINSWNDFAEETAIEPATRRVVGAEVWQDSYGNECPSFYAEIARGYSRMRWGLEFDSYVREETDPSVYRVTPSGLAHVTSMPTCHPVLFVPDGWLAQFPRA